MNDFFAFWKRNEEKVFNFFHLFALNLPRKKESSLLFSMKHAWNETICTPKTRTIKVSKYHEAQKASFSTGKPNIVTQLSEKINLHVYFGVFFHSFLHFGRQKNVQKSLKRSSEGRKKRFEIRKQNVKCDEEKKKLNKDFILKKLLKVKFYNIIFVISHSVTLFRT